MSYDLRERSISDGAPIELYHFALGGREWRFTTAADDVTQGGHTWLAAMIRRDGIEASADQARNNLKLTVPRDFPLADLFRIMPPTDVILLQVYRCHAGDPTTAMVWAGRVLNCSWSGSTASLYAEPVATSLQRVGLRRMYQKQCPHVLYGTACGVSAASYAVSTTLDSTSGLTVSASAFAAHVDGYFAGGYLTTVVDDVTERRFITEHLGANLTLNLPLSALAVGTSVTVYPGCDHSLSTCAAKFANSDNCGGFPFIPTKNPFASSIY